MIFTTLTNQSSLNNLILSDFWKLMNINVLLYEEIYIFSLTVLHNIGCISIYFCYFIIHSANVASSNLAHGEVNLIQRYLIHFLSDLWQVGGLFPLLRFHNVFILQCPHSCRNNWKRQNMYSSNNFQSCPLSRPRYYYHSLYINQMPYQKKLYFRM